MKYTVKEASQETTIDEAVIWKHMRRGWLSATRNQAGEYLIDEVDLFRVFPKQDRKFSELGSTTAESSSIKEEQAPPVLNGEVRTNFTVPESPLYSTATKDIKSKPKSTALLIILAMTVSLIFGVWIGFRYASKIQLLSARSMKAIEEVRH